MTTILKSNTPLTTGYSYSQTLLAVAALKPIVFLRGGDYQNGIWRDSLNDINFEGVAGHSLPASAVAGSRKVVQFSNTGALIGKRLGANLDILPTSNVYSICVLTRLVVSQNGGIMVANAVVDNASPMLYYLIRNTCLPDAYTRLSSQVLPKPNPNIAQNDGQWRKNFMHVSSGLSSVIGVNDTQGVPVNTAQTLIGTTGSRQMLIGAGLQSSSSAPYLSFGGVMRAVLVFNFALHLNTTALATVKAWFDEEIAAMA